MGQLTGIPYEKEPEDIKDIVKDYWTKRSHSFSEAKHEDMYRKKVKSSIL